MTDQTAEIDAWRNALRETGRPGRAARFVLGIFGTGFLAISFGLWLGEGGIAPGLAAMKFGLSVFALAAGLSCIHSTRPRYKADLHSRAGSCS